MSTWTLVNERSEPLSHHPNVEGAQLSALFHVGNGDKVEWLATKGPVTVAAYHGYVNSVRRFAVQLYE